MGLHLAGHRVAAATAIVTMLFGATSCGAEQPKESDRVPVPSATATAAPETAEATPRPSELADGGTRPAFPGPDSSGVPAGRQLKPVTGDYHVTQPGATVQDLDIRGALYIEAPNVTVQHVRVTCSNSHWIVQAKLPGVTIKDSTLTVDRSDPANYCQYGITAGDNAKISGNDISFTPDGLTFVGTSAEVTGNWVHDQVAYPGREDHVDAAQLNGGSPGPFIFRGNHFSVPEVQTGCLALFADFGSVTNVLAEGNLFDGGGYAVYGGRETATHIRFTNNWFGRTFHQNGGRNGPVTYFHSGGIGNEWRNNRWLDTGELVMP